MEIPKKLRKSLLRFKSLIEKTNLAASEKHAAAGELSKEIEALPRCPVPAIAHAIQVLQNSLAVDLLAGPAFRHRLDCSIGTLISELGKLINNPAGRPRGAPVKPETRATRTWAKKLRKQEKSWQEIGELWVKEHPGEEEDDIDGHKRAGDRIRHLLRPAKK